MTYKLTVTKLVENEKYAEQLKEWETRQRYMNTPSWQTGPGETVEARVLEVMLTDEEYAAIKRAVIETWQ